MTDQRPIDPSTLRDGDIVRAKRGEHGVVEGILLGTPENWRITADRSLVSLVSSDCGWTITDILRPVLVKGDRVRLDQSRREGVVVEADDITASVAVTGSTIYANITNITRLPAAPEPAPIEVGDWWQQPENGTAWAVVERDESGLAIPCGHVLIGLRRIDQKPDVILRYREEDVQREWACLDGPPEPPSGTVGVVGALVFQTTHNRGVAQMDGERFGSWATFLAQPYVQARLATLQIVHTLEAE